MSDISDRPPLAANRPPRTPETGDHPVDVGEVIPAYRPSGSIDALQELADVAAQLPHEMARRSGLSVSELHSLRHLSGTPMGPVELAKALGVTSAASSGIVDRLVARGHAERRDHPGDGRRTQVVVTESGMREIYALLSPMLTALSELDAALTQEQRDLVESYLRRATAAMRSMI